MHVHLLTESIMPIHRTEGRKLVWELGVMRWRIKSGAGQGLGIISTARSIPSTVKATGGKYSLPAKRRRMKKKGPSNPVFQGNSQDAPWLQDAIEERGRLLSRLYGAIVRGGMVSQWTVNRIEYLQDKLLQDAPRSVLVRIQVQDRQRFQSVGMPRTGRVWRDWVK